jgi:hypothetical protein
VLFKGASGGVSDMRKIIANTVCFKDESIAEMRFILIMLSII